MDDLAELVGTPFKWGGRGPDVFDCYGLVKHCWKRVHSIDLPDFTSPNDQGTQAALGILQLQLWEQVPCQPHVMAAIRIGRLVSHCGFMLDADTMVHAWGKSGGVTIVRLTDDWRRRITGFHRYVG